jgi:hypothetical protein
MSDRLLEELAEVEASFAGKVWKTLSAVDVSAHIEKKMNLSYLSWAWAWGTLMDHYPMSSYEFEPPVILPDGTCEIWVTVTIADIGAQLKRKMWLPVMDHRNAAIINPDSRAINDTRMRCLTKCLAMFGLGHYIYAGEDVPRQKSEAELKAEQEAIKDAKERELAAACNRNKESIYAIIEAIAAAEHSTVVEAWAEISEEDKKILWVAPTKYDNAPFSTAERAYFKSPEYFEARNQYFGVNKDD